jgi:VanZ family protein
VTARVPTPGGRPVSLLSSVLVWGPVLIWAGLIFWFSAQPDLRFVQERSLDFLVRKAGHMFAFGVLAALLWRALAGTSVRWPLVWAWLGATLYAATDELHQGFTPGRHPSPVDVAIDSLGALIGLCAIVAALAAYRTLAARRLDRGGVS